MKIRFVFAVCLCFLFIGCSQRIVDPVEDDDLSFTILDCAEADEFFEAEEGSSAKPTGYYACVCPQKPSPETPINYTLPETTAIWLTVRNATGYTIKTLIDGDTQFPGHHSVIWDGTNDNGESVKSGIYIFALRTGSGHKANMFILVQF